jgi:CBS domain-containing protein
MVEDRERIKLVGVVTGHDVCCGGAADDLCGSDVRVGKIMRPLFAGCGASETVEVARRKLHEHRATSLPVAEKAGGCL